ncbi:MAG: HIT family protein [archaeon]|nr:HIT family protein [archaeon]
MPKCLFCNLYEKHEELLADTEYFYAVYDTAPVSKGHALIIPKQHIVSFFDLDEDQVVEMFEAIRMVKEQIEEEYHPDGYNIGINEGLAAGRSINHLHVHLIPRYAGDSLVKGGVRNVLGKYVAEDEAWRKHI